MLSLLDRYQTSRSYITDTSGRHGFQQKRHYSILQTPPPLFAPSNTLLNSIPSLTGNTFDTPRTIHTLRPPLIPSSDVQHRPVRPCVVPRRRVPWHHRQNDRLIFGAP